MPVAAAIPYIAVGLSAIGLAYGISSQEAAKKERRQKEAQAQLAYEENKKIALAQIAAGSQDKLAADYAALGNEALQAEAGTPGETRANFLVYGGLLLAATVVFVIVRRIIK